MKNKEAISVAVGTVFFAIPYVSLSLALAPSIILGVAAYGASELIFTKTKNNQILLSPKVRDIIKDAEIKNNELINLIGKLENKTTRENINEITSTINKIIKSIKKNPEKLKQIDNFFDYYLPVLHKIMIRYDEIENQSLSSKEGKKFILSADHLIEEVKLSFKKIFDSLYQSDIVDADAEMKVFNSMLKADGLSAEINIKERDETNE